MKKIMSIAMGVLATMATFAQPGKDGKPGHGAQRLEAMHVAYLTRELALTPEEAQEFWPVYNKFRKEMKAAFDKTAPNTDPLERQQKMLDIRKKYREEFAKSLGNERANKVFGSADRFREMVKHAADKRRKGDRQQRPAYGPQRRRHWTPAQENPR